MNKLSILFFCLYQGIAFAQKGIVYYKPNNASSPSAFIQKSLLKEDIAFWQKVMEESHVNLYHSIPKDKLTLLSDSLLNSLPGTVTHQQALFVIGALAASLNEGHIYLPSSPTTDSLYANHSVRFPFAISNVANDGSLVVEADWSNENRLKKRSQIISINGMASKAFYDKYRLFFGGLETWRQQLVATYFRKLLFLDGIQAPFNLVAVAGNGDTLHYSVNGLNKLQIDSLNKAISNTGNAALNQPFLFERLDTNIGLIRFNSMNAHLVHRFEKFLDSTFEVIKQTKCIGVIIDIRKNGGGDSKLGEMLVNYIASKPYRMGGGMKWKVSSHYKEFLKLTNSDNESYLSQPDGEMLESINPPVKKPENNKNTFYGKIALLIGPNTFSSANMLADGISTYHLAKLFGEPTGESGNDYGEMFNFMLPNTHIIARASAKMFIRASGDEQNFRPTIPDIEVRFTGSKTNDDLVLKAAVNWLLNQ